MKVALFLMLMASSVLGEYPHMPEGDSATKYFRDAVNRFFHKVGLEDSHCSRVPGTLYLVAAIHSFEKRMLESKDTMEEFAKKALAAREDCERQFLDNFFDLERLVGNIGLPNEDSYEQSMEEAMEELPEVRVPALVLWQQLKSAPEDEDSKGG